MIGKPAHNITLADLRALLGTVREGKTIEFKRQMPAATSEERVKFLATVSSLANTAGGDLLIGISAKDGVADDISGIAFVNLDEEKLRLEQLLANGLEPRLPRVEIEAIESGEGRHVLLVRAYRSWIAPHKVSANERFYGRNSAGKYPLDVSELRTAFVLSDSTTERIRNFRRDRLIKIAAGDASLPMQPGAMMIIHVVPFSTFAAGRMVDIVHEVAHGHVMPLPPGRMYQGNNHTPNLDGFVTFSNAPDQQSHAYAQLFRTGAVEGVDVLTINDAAGHSYLSAPLFEPTVVTTVRNYLTFTQSIDLGLPVFVFLSFVGMRHCHFRNRTEIGMGHYDVGPLREDVITLPEVTIESEPVDIPALMRPIFNTVWNAFGFAQSDKYDQQGKWIGAA